MNDLARHAGLGMQFGAVISVFALAGYWLDTKLGTLPLFLIVGVLLGFLGGTYSLIRQVSPKRDSDRPEDGRGSDDPPSPSS